MRSIRIVGTALVSALVLAALGASSASATSYGAQAWGSNTEGQLGNATTSQGNLPVNVCAAGQSAPCTADLGEVAAIAAGGSGPFGFEEHSLALLEGGTVMAWGANVAGALGNGTTTKSAVPVQVCAEGEAAPCSAHLGEVSQIAAGTETSLAVFGAGKDVASWGKHLGNGTTSTRSVPGPVCAVGETAPCAHRLEGATAVSTSETSSIALLEGGTVAAWGRNVGNGSGAGSTAPVAPCAVGETAPCAGTLKEVAAVSAGKYADYALLKSGEVVSWGENAFGVLGNGGTSEARSPGYVCAVGETAPCAARLKHVTAISGGGEHVLALLESGEVVAWGANFSGQLGIGNHTGPEACVLGTACSKVPVLVSELTGVTAIAAGGDHSLALKSGGTVAAWGYNNEGQLGQGGTSEHDSPVAVEDLRQVHGIAAGGVFSLAYGPSIPTVTKVSPESGPTGGGTSVTITGVNFTAATEVKFGNASASYEVVSATTIKATAPAHRPETVNVRVTTAAGTSPRGAEAKFTYLPSGHFEIGRCKKVASGPSKYSNGNCTVLASEGGFEWTPGFVKGGFTGKIVTETTVTLETLAGAKLLCSGESSAGGYLGTKQVTGVVVTLTGCEYAATAAKCSSSGAAEGEVVTHALEGSLGWLNEEADKVGLDLVPAAEEERLLEASCGGTAIKVRGSVIARFSPVNNMSSTFKLNYKQKKGKQEDSHFEGEAEDVLEVSIGGGAYEHAGLALESKLTNEEELEVGTVA